MTGVEAKIIVETVGSIAPEVQEMEFVVPIGQSGYGKSTALRIFPDPTFVVEGDTIEQTTMFDAEARAAYWRSARARMSNLPIQSATASQPHLFRRSQL